MFLEICCSLIGCLVWENLSRVLSYEDSHSEISLIWSISSSSLQIRVLLSLSLYLLIDLVIVKHVPVNFLLFSIIAGKWKILNFQMCSMTAESRLQKWCLWSSFILSQKMTTFFWQCNKKTKRWQFRDFPGGAVVKNPPANAGDTGSSPGPGRSHMLQSN